MKYHPNSTTITITGHRDGDNPSLLAKSEKVAEVCDIAIERMSERAPFLTDVNTRRFIKFVTTYVYHDVDWAGQYVKRQRKIKVNVALTDIEHVIDIIVHEMAHVWWGNAELINMGESKKAFESAIMADLGSIDDYSRGRKLKRAMKVRPLYYVNEIHSIMTEMKYGTMKLDDLVTDEDFTQDEKSRLRRYAVFYDILHKEPATNRLWQELTN